MWIRVFAETAYPDEIWKGILTGPDSCGHVIVDNCILLDLTPFAVIELYQARYSFH